MAALRHRAAALQLERAHRPAEPLAHDRVDLLAGGEAILDDPGGLNPDGAVDPIADEAPGQPLVLGFNILGDGLRDILDPHMREP